jgi:hypothetical protein
MKSMIDNVAVHAIESCLIAGIGDLVSPSSILQMDEDVVFAIASEPSQSRCLREGTRQKFKILQAGLAVCMAYASRKTRGKLQNF